MSSRYISLVFYVAGAALFISWFFIARGIGRNKAGGGGAIDQSRQGRKTLVLGLGFAALAAGAAVAYFR